jgi:hypothetical protein
MCDVYCVHYLLPNYKLLEDNDFQEYIKKLKHKYYLINNRLYINILDSIHYNYLSGTIDESVYEKYVRRTNQQEHSTVIFNKLIQNFDINKMNNIEVYKFILEDEERLVIRDGCHRLSILLFNRFENIHNHISVVKL